MKTKLAVVLSLTVLLLLLVTAGTGTSHAQPPQLTPQAYLPIISVPCLRETSAYMTASAPLIHVGDTLTVTGAIVNECAQLVGAPVFVVYPQLAGVLTPNVVDDSKGGSVGAGQYLTFTMTLQAIGAGDVTLKGSATFENVNFHDGQWWFYWDSTPAVFLTIRVVP
jgi:hypothetical protein